MSRDKVEAELAAAWDEYCAKVESIVERAMVADVIPLLRRRRYRFLAGNGTFYVESRTGKLVEVDQRFVTNDPGWSAALGVLNADIPGMESNSLGSLATNYPRGAK